MPNSDELSAYEKLRLIGSMDTRLITKLNEDMFRTLHDQQIPDLIDITDPERRALQAHVVSVFDDTFGEEFGNSDFWKVICGLGLRLFMDGYAYRDHGGVLPEISKKEKGDE